MLRTIAATNHPPNRSPSDPSPEPLQSHQIGGYELADIPHSVLEEALLQRRVGGRIDTNDFQINIVAAPDPALPRPVSVRLGYHRFSGKPKVIDDFSGSTFVSALRLIARVKNMDGGDELAGTVPILFAEADQPFIEIGLLEFLFPLVAVSAAGAVKSAIQGYYALYPATVQAVLEQQRKLIEALRRDSRLGNGRAVPAATELEIARLVSLHEAGVARFQRRQATRERGFHHLMVDNLRARRDEVKGNGDLSRAFVEEACAILDERLRRHRELPSEESAYQCALTDRLESNRHGTKEQRTALIFTAIGMGLMAGGMQVSAAKSAFTAVADSAERQARTAEALAHHATAHGLQIGTGAIMMTAQVFQATSGALNLRLQRRARADLQDDLAAVRDMFDQLPPDARELYAQDLAFRLHTNLVDQIMAGGLVAGQVLMFIATLMNLVAPGTGTAAAVPGTVLTIGTAIGASVNESRKARYVGEAAPDVVKAAVDPGNLGDRLRDQGHETVLRAIGDHYLAHQHDVVRTHLWHDLTRMLETEDILAPWPTRTPEERRDELRAISLRWRGKARLLPAGHRLMRQALRDRYRTAFFDRPMRAIHEALRDEMAEHPDTAKIVALPEFRQKVLFATLDTLARREGSQTSMLFRHPDGARRVRFFEDDFAEHLKHDPVANAVHLHHHNRILAEYLVPGSSFGRGVHFNALTDLARGLREHRRMADEMETSPGEATTSV
ncbi:hypothetical protein [Xylophilus sp. GOD-11R]|uniref:hypothetical protein n=1 Tax=Xylophilus sp. GOD-11R TaxID=3089814 RepID=UPI00298BF9C9|nr:hypothetical protein [Xylophilus sp. GOD-11R]WPB58244.1 hypothetical protein R9X41_06275 [Xylophilus sp. GOD-11R]